MSSPTTLSGLCTFIATETSCSFAMWAWSSAPKGDYGVVSQDVDSTFFAGGNAERATTGYVDYFTRTDGETVKTTIETALKKSGWEWNHNSVQFEPETGFVHHEWKVRNLG